MNREEIKKYPSLKENLWIEKALKSRDHLKKDLNNAEKVLETAIYNIQKDCQHVWIENRTYDKSMPSCLKDSVSIGYGMNVLISKICSLCGENEMKPKGSNTEICQACWTPEMKHVQTIPGQGERWQVYECQNPKCPYGSWET